MYDGKQVLRVETKYKQADLYNIGIELTKRKGTGNYDKNRTEFNVEYVSMNERNLYQEVKQTLKRKQIDYLDKKNTNVLNGITFTSGPEFFETLGMKFVDSGRTYKKGQKKGQAVKVPEIKSKEDIPREVQYYFDCCMEFLEDYVGEENILVAQVHYDEDTPHLQAYFMPVVNEVNRKCYVKDKDGNVVKEEVKNKKGEKTLVPKLLRDKDGKIVYEKAYGRFLNNDQFWKARGGQNSYARMQDKFNKFITEKGFNMDRGNVGASVEHQTKLEYQIAEDKAELEELSIQKENALKVIESTKEALEKANKSVDKNILNPKKNIVGYNSSDVEKLQEYSKDLEQTNILQQNEIKLKDERIEMLLEENEGFKNNEELIKRNKKIKEQQNTIQEQKREIRGLKSTINTLNQKISDITEKFLEEVDKWRTLFFKVCFAIDKVLHKKPEKYVEDYEEMADAIQKDRFDFNTNTIMKPKKKEKSKDDYEMSL